MGQNSMKLELDKFVASSTTSLESQATKLNEQMASLASGGEVSQEQLTAIQYQMGQYNAKIEALSALTKSIQDTLKSLAQRAG